MEYRWKHKSDPPAEHVLRLHHDLGVDPLLCKLLILREVNNYEQARSFFRPSLKDLHNPFMMKDMDLAVKRINMAMENGQRILIYGDYDVDGTTSVALMYSFLSKHYDLLDTYIPDRYKEGYGISYAGIDYAADNGIALIIALDCGIKAHQQVDYAKEKGIDFIICDHHQPASKIPSAVAVLDPKRSDCLYPYNELSGCGVGFKLVQALCQDWNLRDDESYNLLDFLAISIGADIVPITGENRILAHFGLKIINQSPRLSIEYLKRIAGKEGKILDITDVVFLLAPRINAAGRISHGQKAVSLLISEDVSELEELSRQIDQHNHERKELDSSITEAALRMVERENMLHSTVVYDPDWHKGVIGIVASRLIEKHYRPTIVFTESNGVLAGSARSVHGFDIYTALSACEDILEQFGGHKYAAGMTLKPERLEDFKAKFESVVSQSILQEQKIPNLEIDAQIVLSDINDRFYRILRQFAPHGPGNLAPVFQTDGLLDDGSKVVGKDRTHLKLSLFEPSSGRKIKGIAFGQADKLELLKSGQPVSVAYHITENEFNAYRSLEMMVKDIKLSSDLDGVD
jgi:single-stranded-DNA-specific exonuclease